jgi:hypothetical protein
MTTSELVIVTPDYSEVFGDGVDPFVVTRKVETATNVTNGALVKRGTTDADIVVCGDAEASPLGWVIRDSTIPENRKSDRTTAYTINKMVAVAHGPGCRLVAKASTAIVAGQKLVAAAAGKVRPCAGNTEGHLIVAVAEQTCTADGDSIVITPLI